MEYIHYLAVLRNDPTIAQELNDAIIASRVINASLPKMLNRLINVEGGLGLVVYPHYNKENLSYWGTDGVNGELFYILDALVAADDIQVFNYATLNADNKEIYKAQTSKLAKSETLRQILPKILERSNLTRAVSVRSEVDPYTLNEEQWNNEINILAEVIIILNETQH